MEDVKDIKGFIKGCFTYNERDFNTTHLLYGFILVTLAVIITTAAVGNVVMLSGLVALLLLKDGLPNLIIGAMAIAKKPEKKA